MAGFTDQRGPFMSSIINSIRKIGSFGMSYGDLVVKNSQAVGVTEAEALRRGGLQDEASLYSIRKADTTSKQYIAYFDKDYKSKRIYCQSFCQNPEIEFILDTICDEGVVYDEKNFWSYFAFMEHKDLKQEICDKINDRYKELYNIFGFNQDIFAWHLFRKFLIEGILAFEIIYDTKGKKIIGFKELDPSSIVPSVEMQEDGNYVETWIQYPDNPTLARKLYDSQIIYISYSKGGSTLSRISYVERLIRSFNLLRIMEHTRVIWNVMNSSYRMTMTVPIGTKSPQKAKQTLGELMSIYKEDIRLDSESGELFVNGRPNIQFFKNYLMPSSQNGTPDIQPLGGSGDATAFTDTKALQYFSDKLKLDSKIPFSRFNQNDANSMGTFSSGSDGLDQEEIRFSKFINRLRSIFQDILTKPLWIQFCLDYPELKDDYLLKSEFGLNYVKENMFTDAKQLEILSARKDQVIKIAALKKSDGTPYFSLRFVIDRYLGMNDQDRIANEKAKKLKLNKGENPTDNAGGGEGEKEGEGPAPTFSL